MIISRTTRLLESSTARVSIHLPCARCTNMHHSAEHARVRYTTTRGDSDWMYTERFYSVMEEPHEQMYRWMNEWTNTCDYINRAYACLYTRNYCSNQHFFHWGEGWSEGSIDRSIDRFQIHTRVHTGNQRYVADGMDGEITYTNFYFGRLVTVKGGNYINKGTDEKVMFVFI